MVEGTPGRRLAAGGEPVAIDNAANTTAKAANAMSKRREFVRDGSRGYIFMLFILDNSMAMHSNLSTGSNAE